MAITTVTAQTPVKRPSRPAVVLPPAISATALRAHVSFLASDAMQGRNTPSHELDIAAEYIASQYRRIGLEDPPGGYFQVSEAELRVQTPTELVSISPDEMSMSGNTTLLGQLTKVAVAQGLTSEGTRNRIIITVPEVARHIYSQRETLQPTLIVAVAAGGESDIDGVTTVRSAKLRELYDTLPEGRTDARITLIAPGLKNVLGVLPGTDPKLREQYVILSAHYDHVGVRSGEGDQIFNGANDNASGVAGLIEAAAALKASPIKSRRSIVFIAFFGEEKGLLGSSYYAAHPVFPIESTAANLNLEQLGRTDDSEGPRIAAAIITGFRFSELPMLLAPTMLRAEVKLEENLKNGDAFFQASDNRSLAAVGVPAHTVSVSFGFPDAHRPGDEWQKIDYDNMAKVTRGIAAGIRAIANRAEAPRWLTANPKARPYSDKATLLSKPREASAPKSGNLPASPKQRRSTR